MLQYCPLKYKYRYLLRLPTKTHHSLSFGQTMHQVLHDFHFNEQRGYIMTLPELIDLYSKSFIELGYDNPTHKHQRFEAGKLALANYYSSYPHVFGKPLLLEQSFSMNLDGVKLVGKIDRIDEMSDGKVELIDYKTGEAKKRDQKAVDKDDQLTLYALAAKNVLNLSVDSLSLYYLEGEPNKLTTTREESALIQAKSKLIDQIHQIQNSDFPAKPDPVKCGFCEYLSLCPFATKKSI